MSDKIVSLHGGVIPQGKPNKRCIEDLEEMLEMARSGEIIGVACSILHGDEKASYRVFGLNGGYNMLGAMECAKAVLVETNRAGERHECGHDE